MPRTFADMVDEVLFDEFDRTKYQTHVGRWLNEAIQRLGRAAGTSGNEASYTTGLLADDNTIALSDLAGGYVGIGTPTDGVQKILSVVDTETGEHLTYVDPEELVQVPVQTGTPTHWTVYGDSLRLAPPTDASRSYLIHYAANLQDFVDGSTLPVPDDFAELAINYATAKAFEKENDYEAAAYHEGKFERGLARFRTASERAGNKRRQIPGMLA